MKPVTGIITRWSPNYFLLRRYIDLSSFIDKCDLEIVELLPNPSEELKIQDLIVDLTDIQSVTLKLQEESVTMAEVGRLFDALFLRFHSMCKYLSERAAIVENPQFEAAVAKSFTTPYEDLKLIEKVHLGRFRKQCESISPASHTDSGDKSFAEAVLLTPEPNPACKTMINLNWVPPTSNIVERQFSKAKNVRPSLRNKSFQFILRRICI